MDDSCCRGIRVAVDIVVLTIRGDELCALLIRPRGLPGEDRWALPGGLVHVDEPLRDAALRQLREETHVSPGAVPIEQLATYGDPGRDPRARVVSVAWLAVMPQGPDPLAGADTTHAEWRPVDPLLEHGGLAFDHDRILADGVERARGKLEYTGLATSFVDKEFTVAELRRVYEVVWGRPLDPGNFHRKVTRTPHFLESTGRSVTRGPGRPAELYRFGGAEVLYPPLSRWTFG